MNSLYEYNIISQDESLKVKVVFTDESHPIFQAHFPSNSLLPGFIQFDIVSDILSKDIIEIKKAKFLNPILPNDTINIVIKQDEDNISAVFKKNNSKCSELKFVTK